MSKDRQIRDLELLVAALDRLLVAYRLGRHASEKTLNDIRLLKASLGLT